MIICERPRKEVFQLLVTDYLQFADQQTLNCYENWQENIRNIMCRNAATSEQAMVS